MESPIPANRVFQLESNYLDQEMNKIIDHLVGKLNISSLSEEIKLFLKFYINANHIKNFTTIGMKSFNLSYHETDNQGKLMETRPRSYKLLLLTTCNLILPYLTRRYQYVEHVLNQSPISELKFTWLTFDNLVMVIKSINILNFMIFLYDGKQLLILERLLGLIPGLPTKNYYDNMTINKVQMELLNRETVWRELAEFITFVIPFINVEKVKNRVLKLTRMNPRLTEKHDKLSDRILARKKNINFCAICKKQPFNPFIIGCKHVFCYYCLQSKYLSDPAEGFTCSLCEYRTFDRTQVMRLYISNVVQIN